MNKTNDFKYNLPAYSDPVDIEDLNDNFRGIDDALMAGLCKKDYTGNNMGSSDPSARKYAWAPWFEIVNDNEFDVVVTDRNAPVESEEATINIAAGQTFRKYINGRYYMNFYVQDQHDVTFKWFTNAETYINESGGGGGGTGTVTSVSVQGGSGSHLTASGNPIETSGTITIDIDDGYSIPSDNEQTAWDGKAADLKAEIDSSTYVLTLQLKDSAGNLIGTAKTIDLPLETMVVDGEYDPQTKKIKLELKNGNYVEFSVADLVSGLQTELSASNKLDPDYIDYDSTHRAVSDTEKTTWNGKQNALTFDDTPTQNSNNPVKSGGIYTALTGKQASLDSAQLAAVNSGINSTKVAQISTNQTNILYGIRNGVKNIMQFNHGLPSTSDGVSITETAEGISVKGTATGNPYSYFYVGNITIKAGETYALIDEGRSIEYFYVDSPTAFEEAVPALQPTVQYLQCITSGTYGVYMRANYNVAIDRLHTPMICLKSLYDADPTYSPAALPNYDLTRLEAEDRASLAEVVDSGAKNLVNLDACTITSAYSNITIVARNGNEVTVSCDGTQTTAISIDITGLNVPTNQFLILSGCASGGGDGSFQLDAYNNGAFLADSVDIGNGSNPFKFTTMTNSKIRIRVAANASFTNKVFKIMLCTKAAFGVSQKFVPWCVPIKGVYVRDTAVVCSTTLTTTGIKFTATEKAAYRITATAIYYNSIPLKLVIKYKTNSSANQLPFCSATHADGEDVSLTASGIISLDVGGEFEVFAQYASSTSNYFYVLVEKIG